MDKSRKKYIALVIVTIVISVIVLAGASYALLTMTLEGDKKVSLTAGILKVDFAEGNNINLDNVAPMTDAQGQKTTPYTFTITNTGNINAYYHVSLEEDVNNTLPNSYLKMRLTGDNGYDSGVVKVSGYGTGSFDITSEATLKPSDKVTYQLWMWLDYNADNSAQGKEYKSKIVVTSYDREQGVTVSNALLNNIPKENQYDDGVDTFITGEDPNNYIWYSGKLWRAVSVNNEAKTVKLVTQWNISATTYNASGNTAFEGSYMEDWLNDTTVDGFLGNLRDYEKFIVTDAVWDATLDATSLGSITRPNGEATVTAPVGLLNMYEYQSSYHETTYSNGYLNNGLYWWTLTPYSASYVRNVTYSGHTNYDIPSSLYGVRPSINLKSSVKIVDGDGTADNPYRLNGDNDTDLTGTLLSSRYSGEYIRFGSGENNLYRIVSHENGTGTKIVSAEPLKNSDTFITSAFGSNTTFSSTNTIGTFLNGNYLTNYVGSSYSSMIEDSTTWYLGTVGSGTSYKLAKYTDTNMSSLTSSTTDAKVGLLRMGELMSGQFERYSVKGGSTSTGLTTSYWTLTPYSSFNVRYVGYTGDTSSNSPSRLYGVRPSINLKSNVEITSGTGTKSDPFVLSLGS